MQQQNFQRSVALRSDAEGLIPGIIFGWARGSPGGFTGIHDPYEPPLNCEVVLDSRRKHSNTKGWTFSKVYGQEKPSYKSLNDNQYYTPTKAPLPANSNSLKRGQTSLHGSST
ncbi:hypothetical protein CK203_046226 [Vitis vinifera]|uniref:Uncharacterized protein n=1 Tax=Vitis vinifera TaxID=29760 RepID=A0A438HDR3_VITVI|nr:hypothetical protein CK203_046226 [Vitis vinifera]